MLSDKSPKFIFGLIACSIYFLMIGLLVFYFNTYNNSKPKHYVKKNENRIQVALTTPKKKNNPLPKPKDITPAKVKKKKELKKPKKPVLKTTKKKSPEKKKIIKEKVVKKSAKKPLKKKEETNSTKVPKKKKITKKVQNKKIEKKKIQKTSDLFSKVTSKPKNVAKKEITNTIKNVENRSKPKSPSALEKIQRATSSKQSNKGIENAYFAKVQSLLETWPAQSEYAGQKAMVRIYVKPTGAFDFKVKSKSNNLDFNLGLIDFLEQLKKLGLGSHKGGKTYEIEVEFTAKE